MKVKIVVTEVDFEKDSVEVDFTVKPFGGSHTVRIVRGKNGGLRLKAPSPSPSGGIMSFFTFGPTAVEQEGEEWKSALGMDEATDEAFTLHLLSEVVRFLGSHRILRVTPPKVTP